MMGDEADADWQDGLVEWGIEDTKERYRQQMERAVRTSPFRNRQKKRRSPVVPRPERQP